MTSQSDSTIEDQLIALIREAFDIDAERMITPDSFLADELEIDSLSLVKLDMLVEARLGMALPMEYIDDVATVRDLATALRKYGVRSAD